MNDKKDKRLFYTRLAGSIAAGVLFLAALFCVLCYALNVQFTQSFDAVDETDSIPRFECLFPIEKYVAYDNLGAVYYSQQRFSEAEEMYKRALESLGNTGDEREWKLRTNIALCIAKQALGDSQASNGSSGSGLQKTFISIPEMILPVKLENFHIVAADSTRIDEALQYLYENDCWQKYDPAGKLKEELEKQQQQEQQSGGSGSGSQSSSSGNNENQGNGQSSGNQNQNGQGSENEQDQNQSGGGQNQQNNGEENGQQDDSGGVSEEQQQGLSDRRQEAMNEGEYGGDGYASSSPKDKWW